MPKIALEQGSYQARSPIANAQVCLNLYPEPNTKDAPFPVTHYPAPGLTLFADYSTHGSRVRGLYVASSGQVFCVVDQTVLYINETGTAVVLGTLPTNSGNPISMTDNGTDVVLVDGTTYGATILLSGPPSLGSLIPIVDSAFYGSTRVDYIDTFVVFNKPATPPSLPDPLGIPSQTFYTTTSNVITPFDPLYFANKAGWNDPLVVACCLHDNIWLLGQSTTEIWYNAGAAAFPFARMPNSILQQGCVAPYSPVITDNALYWLSQDRWGRNLMMRGEGYGAKRVSNFAVEHIWSTYPTISDAIGMSYQIGGHETIGIYFPSGNAWWAYDASTQMWHQRTFGGTTDAWLPYCSGFARPNLSLPPSLKDGALLMGDRSSGKVYILQENAYTDNGTAITRQRSWTHLQGDDGQRVAHQRFSASFAGASLAPDTLALDWSDDAGQTFGTPVNQTIGNATNGQYQWRRLGYARDRVYRLTWSGNGESALNGAYVDVIPHGT